MGLVTAAGWSLNPIVAAFSWFLLQQAEFTIFRVATGALSLKSRRGAAWDRSTMRPSNGRKGLPPQQAANCLPPLSLRPSGLPPKDSHACCTPWSVFQDGSDAAIRTPTTSARGDPSPSRKADRFRKTTDRRAVADSAARPTGRAQPSHLSHRRDRQEKARAATCEGPHRFCLSSVASFCFFPLLGNFPDCRAPGLYAPRAGARGHLPRKTPTEPEATAVGRLPAEVQSGRRETTANQSLFVGPPPAAAAPSASS